MINYFIKDSYIRNLKIVLAHPLYISSGGKKSVLELFEYVEERSKKMRSPKNHYIVDRDYDNNTLFQNARINILPAYSIENFIVSDDNLKVILSELLDENLKRVEKIIETKNRYEEYIVLYCAWKKVIIENNILTDYDFIGEEIQQVKINKNGKWRKFEYTLRDLNWLSAIYKVDENSIEEEIEFLRENPNMLIGKITFVFIRRYIKEVYKMEIHKDEFLKRAHKLKIEFDII